MLLMLIVSDSPISVCYYVVHKMTLHSTVSPLISCIRVSFNHFRVWSLEFDNTCDPRLRVITKLASTIDKLGARSKVLFQCLGQSQYQSLSQSLTWTLELVTIIAMPPPDSRLSPAYSRLSLLKLFWEWSENILTILGFLMSMTPPGLYSTYRMCVKNILSSKDPTWRWWIGVFLTGFLMS